MTTFDAWLTLPVVQQLGWVLLHFVWQGIFIGILCGALLRLPLAKKPRAAYGICMSGLFLCALAPVVTFYAVELVDVPPVLLSGPSLPAATQPAQPPPAPVFVPEAKDLTAGFADMRHVPEVETPPPWHERVLTALAPYVPWLVVMWLPIAALLSARLTWEWGQTRLWVRAGSPVADEATQGRLAALGARIGVRGKVLLLESARVLGPLTVGFFKPAILLPVGFMAGVSPAHLEAILLHELAHIRRWDYALNLLVAALTALLFYHPVVWWLDRRTRLARELCCDALAANRYGDLPAYAQALAAAQSRASTPHALAPAASDGPLLARIRALAGLRAIPAPSARSLANLTALLALSLGGALMLSSAMAENPDVSADLHKPAPSGRVLGMDGKSMAGVDVFLYHLNDWRGPGNGVVETVKTDADGHFSFAKGIHFGRVPRSYDDEAYYVLAFAPAQALALKIFDRESKKTKDIELKLSAPQIRRVRVTDKNGAPMPGATVNVHWIVQKGEGTAYFKPGFEPLVAISDAQGVATFAQLPKRNITFTASKSGFSSNWSGCDSGNETESDICLRPGACVEGRVVNTEGKSVAGVIVYATPRWSLSDYDYTYTDADGRFRLEGLYGKGDCWTEGGGTGEYRMGIESANDCMPSVKVRLNSGESKSIREWVVSPGVRIAGVLLDPKRKQPMPGVCLEGRNSGGEMDLLTDAEGRFEFLAPPGEFSLSVRQPPLGFYLVSDHRFLVVGSVGMAPQELTLYAASGLGRMERAQGSIVNSDGKPAVGVQVEAWLMDTRDLIVSAEGRTPSMGPVTTDEAGGYAFPAFPRELPMRLCAAGQGEAAIVDAAIAASPGGALPTITLKKSLWQRVRVLDINGHPLAGKTVLYAPRTIPVSDGHIGSGFPVIPIFPHEAKTDADGFLTLEGIPQGYDVAFWLKGKSSSWKWMLSSEIGKSDCPVFVLSEKMRIQCLNADGHPLALKGIGPIQWSFHHPDKQVDPDYAISKGDLSDADVAAGWWLMPKASLMFAVPGASVEMCAETPQDDYVPLSGKMPQFDNALVLQAPRACQEISRLTTPPFALRNDQTAYRATDDQGRPLAGVKARYPNIYSDDPPIEAVTDADGWCVLEGFDRQPYAFYVEFTKPGYATQWTADVARGRGHTVEMSQKTRLKGQLLGPEGQPAGRVKFYLTTERRSQTSLTEEKGMSVADIPLRAETDEQGCYDLLISPGNYRVQAESDKGFFLTVPSLDVPSGKTAAIDERMGHGAQVTMAFIDSLTGKPAQGVGVVVVEEECPGCMGDRKNSQRTSGADGLVKWESLPPGRVDFYLKSGKDMPYARWWTDASDLIWFEGSKSAPPRGRDGIGNQPINLKVGPQTISMTVERGIHLSGKVILPKNVPEKGDIVVSPTPVSGERGSLTQDSYDDIFVDKKTGEFAAWMPAGNGYKYRMCAFYNPPYDEKSPVYLPAALSEPFDSKPGERFRFELSMLGGGWLKGRVVDGQGKPCAGLKIVGIPTDHAGGTSEEPEAVTDADGRFSMGPIRATEYGIVPQNKLYREGIDYHDYQKMGTVQEGKITDVGDFRFPDAPQKSP